MARYIIIYVGGEHPSSPQQGQQHFARYMDWLSGLGDAVVSPANPFMNTLTVNPDGAISEGGNTGVSGYTIVQADSMDAALDMARTCPFLDINGSLEVSELAEMPASG